MKISYLVTCSTETDTLTKMLEFIYAYREPTDEFVLLNDSGNTSPETHTILKNVRNYPNMIQRSFGLNNNYGEFKNVGIQNCSGDYIFQIDGDEVPTYMLVGNFKEYLTSNPDVEAWAVPRLNDFEGVEDKHAKQWGWRMDMSNTTGGWRINWPDYQFRIFKRDYPRISFTRRLHEKIEGYSSFACLHDEQDQPSEQLCLHHIKNINKQIETNLKYNNLFSEQENQGHNVFGQKK